MLGFDDKVTYAWNKAILNTVANDFKAKAQHAVNIHTKTGVAFPWWDSESKHSWMYLKFYNRAKLALAQNLEKCGRTQDAAKVFEELCMYDKSRELRETDRHIVVKNTNVSINLNTLLQQVKDGGIVAVFRCPFCGGKLKINKNTTLDSLKLCEHCNSEITSMDLADFLKTNQITPPKTKLILSFIGNRAKANSLVYFIHKITFFSSFMLKPISC